MRRMCVVALTWLGLRSHGRITRESDDQWAASSVQDDYSLASLTDAVKCSGSRRNDAARRIQALANLALVFNPAQAWLAARPAYRFNRRQSAEGSWRTRGCHDWLRMQRVAMTDESQQDWQWVRNRKDGSQEVSDSQSAPKVDQAELLRDELRQHLRRLNNSVMGFNEEEVHVHNAIGETINKMLPFYEPVLTMEFMKFLISGEWQLIYTTVGPLGNNPLDASGDSLVRMRGSHQQIEFEDMLDGTGSIINKLQWEVPSDDNLSGVLVVDASFEVSRTDGSLEVSINSHTIDLAEKRKPSSPQELVKGIQALAAAQFDPQGKWMIIYADPEIRMMGGVDERLEGVVLVFERVVEERKDGEARREVV